MKDNMMSKFESYSIRIEFIHHLIVSSIEVWVVAMLVLQLRSEVICEIGILMHRMMYGEPILPISRGDKSIAIWRRWRIGAVVVCCRSGYRIDWIRGFACMQNNRLWNGTYRSANSIQIRDDNRQVRSFWMRWNVMVLPSGLTPIVATLSLFQNCVHKNDRRPSRKTPLIDKNLLVACVFNM